MSAFKRGAFELVYSSGRSSSVSGHCCSTTEFEFALRASLKVEVIDCVIAKHEARDLSHQGRGVASELIECPKRGSAVPLSIWLRRVPHPWAREPITSQLFTNSGLIYVTQALRLWSQNVYGLARKATAPVGSDFLCLC